MSLVQDLGQDQTCSCAFSQGLFWSLKKNSFFLNHLSILESSKMCNEWHSWLMSRNSKTHCSYILLFLKIPLQSEMLAVPYQRGLGVSLPSYLCVTRTYSNTNLFYCLSKFLAETHLQVTQTRCGKPVLYVPQKCTIVFFHSSTFCMYKRERK